MCRQNLVAIIVLAFTGTVIAQVFNFLAGWSAKSVNARCSMLEYYRTLSSGQSKRKFLRDLWLRLTVSSGVGLAVVLLAACSDSFLNSFEMQAIIVCPSLFAVGSFSNFRPYPAVIPISWSFIYAGCFLIILMGAGTDVEALQSTLQTSFLNWQRDVVVVTGTILGVCMTILWTMDTGNLQGVTLGSEHLEPEDRERLSIYRGLWALYMVTHFTVVFTAIFVWLALPTFRILGFLG